MQCTRKVCDDLFWVGASDRRIELFENLFPVPNGVSYNSYLLIDEKTVLFDTVDYAVGRQLFENLAALLDGRKLDYVVVNHMEPDHCATLQDLVLRYPDVTVVGNAKTIQMIKQFFTFDIDSRAMVVKEGDSLNTGKHELSFVMAPMVHWPEAMFTFDKTNGVLFSADAFGTFGALNGNIFNDEIYFDRDWLDDARRYYTNIVGKYGPQVQAVLKKAAGLDIRIICPLHGPIWRSDLGYLIGKYDIWSRYEPEEDAVMIAYSSVYGDTQNVVDILAAELAEAGEKDIRVYDVSKTDVSYLVSDAFRCSKIILAATTYNGGLYPKMETFLLDLKAHSLKNRTVAIIENGTWAAMSGKHMREILNGMDVNIIEETLSIKSAIKENQLADLQKIAAVISARNKEEEKPEVIEGGENMSKYICTVCGYEYDPAVGDPEHGIAPGTAFEDLPDDWKCPVCFVGIDMFSKDE